MAERVWDRFLTERDRAHLAHRTRRRLSWGERPGLLLIDLYRWVFGDEPEPLPQALERWPGSCGLAGWNALPHIQRVLACARDGGIPAAPNTGLATPERGRRSKAPRPPPKSPARGWPSRETPSRTRQRRRS